MLRTALFTLAALLILFQSPAFARRQHVHGYYRSNGTYVHGYDRTVADGDPIVVLIFLLVLAVIVVLAMTAKSLEESSRRPAPFRSYTPPRRSYTFVLEPESGAPPKPQVDFLAAPRAVWRFVTCAWLESLPEWLRPVSLVAFFLALSAIPAAAAPARQAIPSATLSVVLSLAGCFLGYLAFDIATSGKAEQAREQDEAKMERIKAFRAALVRKLRAANEATFDFAVFSDAHGISRQDAAVAADNVYLGLCRKVVADGIVTPDERTRLIALARALEIDDIRCERIESQAKSDRYRTALKEAMADGVITEEEQFELDLLRETLGLGGDDVGPSRT